MSIKEIYEEFKQVPKQDTIKVSYYIIDYCVTKKYNITNLKLNKLLYFINIEYMLKNNGIPLFDEEFKAWRHGPVLESVYKYFRLGIATSPKERLELIKENLKYEKLNIIDKVLNEKAQKTASELVEITHIKDGPWELTYNKNKDNNGICIASIPNQDIYNFYKGIENGL